MPDFEEIRSGLQKVLRSWPDISGDSDAHLGKLLVAREIQGKLISERQQNPVRKIIEDSVSQLDEVDKTGARILRRRFFAKDTIRSIAYDLNVSQDHVNRLQKKAIDKIADHIFAQEKLLREKKADYFISNLPIRSTPSLFGFDQYILDLSNLILASEPPWMFSIVGIGGIGKTSLVEAIVSIVIRQFQFENYLWINAETFMPEDKPIFDSDNVRLFSEKLIRSLLPADIPPSVTEQSLRKLLRSSPHLIVVDGLQDEFDTTPLYKYISSLVNPSKFIFTSRRRPSPQAESYTFLLRELHFEAAKSLLCHQTESIGLTDSVEDMSHHAQKIYAVVGGNPLALKLAVGLLDAFNLDLILQDFSNIKIDDIQLMYQYIYWKTWNTLRDNSKELLQAMPMISSSGGGVKQLIGMSGLSEEKLLQAVQELITRSLLETKGDMNDRRYGIHRLTKRFLETEIIHWPKN